MKSPNWIKNQVTIRYVDLAPPAKYQLYEYTIVLIKTDENNQTAIITYIIPL